MALEPSSKERFYGEKKQFRANAYLLIETMVKMDNETKEDTSFLVDEVLHSIFFLGILTFTVNILWPEIIFDGNEEFLQYLKEAYPQPFGLCYSQLPRRSPFSCVLDMVVKLFGPEQEDLIKDKLQQLIEELKQNDNSKMLFSTILCVSSVPDSGKYYGVSMSTHRKPARQIVIASACLNFWDNYVAGAVMTYCPQKKKRTYYDGTIQLSTDVSCEAFSIQDLERKHPCLSCKNMFNLETTETKNKSPYGNCAEAESLSNLFKNERNVKERVTRSGNVRENEKAREEVLHHLRQVLKRNNFVWDDNFYIPQSASLANGGEREESPVDIP